MTELTDEQLIDQAASGDDQAFVRLFLRNRRRLDGYVREKLPDSLRTLFEPRDILQDVCQLAFRGIGGFKPQGDDAAFRWLVTIARHRMAELLRGHMTAKRGGSSAICQNHKGEDLAGLLEQMAVYHRTPSKSAIRHELARDIELSMQNLPGDYREALRLRYFEGLAIEQIALRMNRSKGAAQMLCNRGLKQLRSALGSASRYA
jgi:RNA polymerase sigma-70 factor (ECF subfamily)